MFDGCIYGFKAANLISDIWLPLILSIIVYEVIENNLQALSLLDSTLKMAHLMLIS